MSSDTAPASPGDDGSAPPFPGQELELKMALSAAAAEQVRRSRPVRALKHGRALTRRLRSVYFDTPDQALRRGGFSLRVRHIGTRRVQTVKAEPDRSLGLAARREWEADISGDLPDLDAVGDAVLRRALDRLLAGRELRPMFESDIRRTAWELRPAEGRRVELALDVGCLAAGGRREPVHEVELELKDGPVSQIFDIAAELNRTVPFRFESRSKADRGYALASEEPPPVLKAKAVALEAGLSAQQAFVAVAASCLAQAEANEAAAADGRNPEGVHQLRVACRRLRSAFSLFRPVLPPDSAGLAAELKWFAGELGAARDWDVFLAETLAPLRRVLPEEAALADLQSAAERRRAEGYRRARAAIAAPRYTAAKLELRRWLADRDWHRSMDADAARLLFAPATELAGRLLQRRAKAFRRLGRRHAELTLPQLHELRIRGKKLRYATEFFATLYPGRKARSYGGALARLQDVLGVLNDSVVAHDLLERAAAAEGDAAAAWSGRADGILTGWYAAHTQARLLSLDAAWRDFAGRRRFWDKPARRVAPLPSADRPALP